MEMPRRYYSIQHAPIKCDTSTRLALNEEKEKGAAQYFWAFPTLMLNFYTDNYSTNLIAPLRAERTLTVFEWYFREPEKAETQEAITRTIEFNEEIQREDIAICETVQRNLRSRTYTRGRYSFKRENGVHHFHSLLAEFLGQK